MRVGVQLLTGLGEQDVAAVASKEHGAEVFLQGVNALTDGGLREAQRLRGGGEAAQFRAARAKVSRCGIGSGIMDRAFAGMRATPDSLFSEDEIALREAWIDGMAADASAKRRLPLGKERCHARTPVPPGRLSPPAAGTCAGGRTVPLSHRHLRRRRAEVRQRRARADGRGQSGGDRHGRRDTGPASRAEDGFLRGRPP